MNKQIRNFIKDSFFWIGIILMIAGIVGWFYTVLHYNLFSGCNRFIVISSIVAILSIILECLLKSKINVIFFIAFILSILVLTTFLIISIAKYAAYETLLFSFGIAGAVCLIIVDYMGV